MVFSLLVVGFSLLVVGFGLLVVGLSFLVTCFSINHYNNCQTKNCNYKLNNYDDQLKTNN
jgi:hypothetical protein